MRCNNAFQRRQCQATFSLTGAAPVAGAAPLNLAVIPRSLSALMNVIQEPIILDGDGGADVFRTKDEAENYTEPIDIENGEYVAYDASGRLLDLSVSPDGHRGQLTLPDSPEKRGD